MLVTWVLSSASQAMLVRLVMNEALVHWLMAPDAEAVSVTLEDVLRRPVWQQDGACRGQGVRTWFSGAPEQVDRARVVCGACPVRAECLAFAVADDSLVGVSAGFTAKERREMRRTRVA